MLVIAIATSPPFLRHANARYETRDVLLRRLRFDRVTRHDVRPPDQTPVFLDSPAQCDLFTDIRARWCREGEFGGVGLDAHDFGACGCGSNVDH